jgi:hypothetical protein
MTQCVDQDDCHVLIGQCGAGLGGCHHVVNTGVSQMQLDDLGQAWTDAQCGGGVCDCAEPPSEVECTNDVCVAG